MQIDPLFDIISTEVTFVVRTGNTDTKSDIEYLDRGVVSILLETGRKLDILYKEYDDFHSEAGKIGLDIYNKMNLFKELFDTF